MKQQFSIEERITLSLRRINRAIDVRSRDLLKKYGLTGPQLTVLRAIQAHNPITAGLLAEQANMAQATLTGILDRLEESKLLQRTRDDADRRTVRLHVTDQGQKLLESAPSLLHGLFQERLAALPDWEQTQLLSALQKIASLMEVDVQAPPSSDTLVDFIPPPINPNTPNA